MGSDDDLNGKGTRWPIASGSHTLLLTAIHCLLGIVALVQEMAVPLDIVSHW